MSIARFIRSACPCRSKTPCEVLCRHISLSREGEHRSILRLCNLSQDVGGGAESLESQLFTFAGDHKRTPADQTGTEQRGECHVAADLAERKREASIGDCRRRACIR
jgi:hypothetical protein